MTGFYKEYDDTSGAYVSSAENAAAAALVSKNEAADSASSAAASEVSAGNQATAASASETNAATSETNAATSATNAATSETNAGNSATAAAGSATSASTDAGTATTKASEASTSATNAATSETNAASSATNAATSETNAATSATNAASSATTASTQATNAASSATAAATSETNAGNSATAAATSETNAASSATSASGSATTATTKAGEASTSATNAATSETNAATSATNSANSATSAGTAQTAAEAARDAALAAFDSFDDRYLGQKASNPTVDNDGNALVAGTLYFNTTTDEMKVYDGSTWLNAYASLSGALLATSNLSDLNNAATARTNLGLGTAATTASTDYATAAQGTKVDGIEASADVTDTANVTAAGALMDSELTSEASVKALDQGVATTDSPAFAGLTVDTTTLAVDSTNNRVGIGTTTPAFSLDIVADDPDLRQEMPSTSASSLIQHYFTVDGVQEGQVVYNKTSGSEYFGLRTTRDITFQTGGSEERMRIDSSGRVGIGTSSPAYSLVIGDGTDSSEYLQLKTTNTGTGGILFGDSDSAFPAYLWYNHSGNRMEFGVNGSERMRIDSSGKVGIGEAAPETPLHVKSADNAVVLVESTDTKATTSFKDDTTTNNFGVAIGCIGDDLILQAGTTSSVDMTIKADGKVGIGTTIPKSALGVVGQITGGFGAISTSGTLNWNHITNARSGMGFNLLLGTAPNGPGGSTYFHVVNYEYSSKNGVGNMTQIAYGYNTTKQYQRYRYSGNWSSWATVL